MIYFIIYLLLETLISVEISSQLGGLNTFLEMVFSAIVGFFIISNFQQSLIFNVTEFVSGGINLNQLKSRNIFPFVGAILLIAPGFLTDFIGLIFQFSIITDLFIKDGPKYKSEDLRKRDFEDNYKYNQYREDDMVIDVEVIEKDIKK
jgi:2-isopropylmalate synthase/UPF0716 protein FxsA